MGTELATIFSDGPSEYTALLSATPSIDLTDWQCGPTTTCPSVGSGSTTTITGPVATVAYYEFQIMLANNFWGINMNFGNSAAGQQLRQGVAHMIDKTLFATNDPTLTGVGTAIDNPLPTSIGGGLPSANPCAWDGNFTETGAQCIVGAAGGTAYHLASATGANGISWLPAPGSADLNAAAQHFVNALSTVAGCSTISFNTATSVLNIPAGCTSPSAVGHVPTFFVRSDDLARFDMGNSVTEEICYLFTGSYTVPCTYLNRIQGPITAFPGFQTSPTSVNLNWWMYTGGYLAVYPFDSSLYFSYNSHFVDSYNCTGQVGCNAANPFPLSTANGGPCSSQAVATSSAGDYMYVCNSSYDSITNQMEFAPCLSAIGDPAAGQTNNGPGGICTGTTSSLSAVSAGVQAEDLFGKNAFTIPIFTTSQQYGYLNNWSRVVNNDGLGVPNFFTWLNAYNPNPAQTGTIRQGFSEGVGSLNPYIASTAWDFYLLGNIYDSLTTVNPLANSQLLQWMTIAIIQLPNSNLGYSPPAGTVSTFRFTVRSDVFWQDGKRVTPWDVEFSYLTLLATGAFQGGSLSPVVGINVISPTQVDVHLNAVGPFTLASLTSPTIIPGRYWSTCSGSLWDGYVSANQVPNSCMQADPNKITPFYDPLANGILIGSSAWECVSSSGVLGAACSANGFQSGASSYTLTRFGKGLPTGSGLDYFRSSANLALWVWSQDNGGITHDLLNYSVASLCFNSVSVPIGTVNPCEHFQTGIGGPTGTISVGTVGTTLKSDSKLRYVGSTPFGPGDTVIYNVNGGTTYTTGDIVIGCYSTPTLSCIPTTPVLGTVLNSDPLLKFYDNPGISPSGVWVNGKGIVYDADNSGGYDFGDISRSQYSNNSGYFLSPASGINIPAPPPGGCPASASGGCWEPEGSTQIGIVALRVGLGWVAPFNWALSPPTGIAPLPPVLHEGSIAFNPSSIAGCTNPYSSTSPTSGGYDC
jgi:hypothetical protein